MLARVKERIDGLRQSSDSLMPAGVDALRNQVTQALAASPLLFDYAAEIERRARRAWNEPLGGESVEQVSAKGKPIHIDPEVEEELVIAASNLCNGVSCPSTTEFIRQVRDVLCSIGNATSGREPARETGPELNANKCFLRSIPCALTFIEFPSIVRVIAASIDVPHPRQQGR